MAPASSLPKYARTPDRVTTARRVTVAVMAIAVMVLLSPSSYAGGATPPAKARQTATPTSHQHPSGVAADDVAEGMVFSGLHVPGKGECQGETDLFVLKGTTECTHGPDPAPPGVDIKKSVVPLAPDHIDEGDAVCSGDGVTGMRTQVIYARASDAADRYATFLPSIRQWAVDANNIYLNSALETGGVRNVRFVHDASCNIVVANVVLNTTGDDTFDNTISQLSAAGYNRTDRKYMIFEDANVYCGIGTFAGDDQPGAGNASNSGPSYGRSDNGCWDGHTAAHEHMHNLGGVNLNAPHTSGGAHCVDEYDVMCYSDSPNFPTMQILCPDTGHENRFDCGHDDYYNTAPAVGSYLATHWNTANSTALIVGGPLRTVSGVVRGPPGENSPLLQGAKVTLLNGPSVGTVSTGANGNYTISGVPDGSYTFTAQWGCYGPVTTALQVNGNETLNFALNRRNDGSGFSCKPASASYLNASTALTLTGDDQSATVALPFGFRFQGQTRTTAYVSTNGVLNFSGPDTAFANTAIPAAAAPNAAIYAFWDDLVVDASASVRVQTLGAAPSRRFVVEWRNVYLLADPSKRLGFEIVLYEDGDASTNDQFRLQYTGIDANTTETGTSATIGWENNAGSAGLQYSLNSGLVSNGLALQASPK